MSDDLGGPNVTKSGRQEGQCQSGPYVRKTLQALEMEKEHEPRDSGSLQKLEKARRHSPLEVTN
jgi:hypothetical protein